MIRLITGGARSGKSLFAENLYQPYDEVCYIATASILDDEMKERIDRHRNQRNKNWRTFEGFQKLDECVEDEKFYLLDDVTNLISNILFEEMGEEEELDLSGQKRIEKRACETLQDLIETIRMQEKSLILVTNEVGSSIVPVHPIARAFRDIQGRVNQWIATHADEVYLVVCGLEMRIK